MDLTPFLTTTVRPALRQLPHLYSVNFSIGQGWLTQNVINMLRACDGSAVGKIVFVNCVGRFVAHPSAPGSDDDSLSFPNVTEVVFLARELDTSLVHPWLSLPLKIFPRLRVMTVGVIFGHGSQGVHDLHHNVLLPKGFPGLRCFQVVWYALTPSRSSEPNSATEESMPMLAIGSFPEVILDYRVDVYNDIAILWWCRVFENLEVSVIETLSLVVYIAAEDLTSLKPWEKLDGILSSWRFHLLKEFTLQFWVTPEGPGERQNDGRVALSKLEFPELSRKVKTRILIDSKPVPYPFRV